MEEQILPPGPSVSDSFINVLTSPAEAFTGLHTKASTPSLWVVPLIATILFVIAQIFIQFRISPFAEQMKDTQRAAIQKMVTDGKMTQEIADQAMEQSEKMGGLQLGIGMIAGSIFIAIFFFLGGLAIWLVAKLALKAPVAYGKMLEIYGITWWIGLVGSVFTLILMFGLGTMYARPAASLAVLSTYDPFNTMHKYMTSLDVFAVWQTAIIGVALSKVSGKSVGLSIGIAFILWIVYVVLRGLLGVGF